MILEIGFYFLGANQTLLCMKLHWKTQRIRTWDNTSFCFYCILRSWYIPLEFPIFCHQVKVYFKALEKGLHYEVERSYCLPEVKPGGCLGVSADIQPSGFTPLLNALLESVGNWASPGGALTVGWVAVSGWDVAWDCCFCQLLYESKQDKVHIQYIASGRDFVQ